VSYLLFEYYWLHFIIYHFWLTQWNSKYRKMKEIFSEILNNLLHKHRKRRFYNWFLLISLYYVFSQHIWNNCFNCQTRVSNIFFKYLSSVTWNTILLYFNIFYILTKYIVWVSIKVFSSVLRCLALYTNTKVKYHVIIQ